MQGNCLHKDPKTGKKNYMISVFTDVSSTSTEDASTSADTASASIASFHAGRAKPVLDTLRRPLTTRSSKVQECSCVSTCVWCILSSTTMPLYSSLLHSTSPVCHACLFLSDCAEGA